MTFVLLLMAAMIVTVLPMKALADSTPVTLVHEDAEEATYDEWNARWERFDANSTGLADQDYWCRLAHNNHGGSHAIYASRVGYNSHYLIPVTMADGEIGYTQAWNVNATGLPGTTSQSQWVPRYDTGQDSIMRKTVVGASDYSTVTLTFWFWSDTGVSDAKQPLDGSTIGYDFLNVVYWTGTGDGMVKHVLWTDNYAQAIAKTWIKVTLTVPNDLTKIGFEFVSGSVSPSGGDSNNAYDSQGIKIQNGGMKEGVYLDDIDLVGSDASVSNVPVETSVDDLAQVQNSHTFTVGYAANSPTAGFSHVNLYYRAGSTGDWTKYGGEYTTSPITFTAPSDGIYEFFTQGFDDAGGNETLKNAPEASTVVDTVAPSTSIEVTGTSVSTNTYSGSATFTLSAAESGSGINATYYRVDSSSWIRYTGPVTLTNGGTHLVQYYSQDMAGNVEQSKALSLAIQTTNPVITFPNPEQAFTSSTVTVRFVVSASSAINQIRASLDGGTNSTIDANLNSVTFTGLTSGTHRVTIWAMDADGRWGQNMTRFSVEVSGNSTTPSQTDSGTTLSLGSLSASYSVGDIVHLTWSCTTNHTIDHYTILVDGSTVATLLANSTSYDLAGLSAGNHAITVMAVDSSGNTALQSATVTVKAGATSGAGDGGIAADVLIVGGIALVGVLVALMLVFLRSRKMY
ncbi:MAG: hypothetical protein SA339_04220 [Methanomassiliicoccus sp.]|nr:hypothetical protein [Methanomassiliicoccus sp.]